MTHNTRTRVDLAAWSSATAAVLPSELDKLDGFAYSAINGDAGGIWSPAATIFISGAGLTVSGLFTTNGAYIANGVAFFENTVTCLTTVLIQGLLTATAGAHISGSPLTVDSAAVFNSISDFFDDVTLHTSADLLVGGSGQLGNDATKTLLVNASSTFASPVTFNGLVDFFVNTTVHTAAFFQIGGNSQIGNDATKTLDVEATTTFNAAVTMNSTLDVFSPVLLHTSAVLNVNAPANFNGAMVLGDTSADAIDVPGKMNLHNALLYSFNGRVPVRPILASDNDHSYAVSDGNEIYYYQNIAIDHHLTLLTAGAIEGDSWEVTLPNTGSGNGPLLTISDGTNIICLLRAKGGNFALARIRFSGGLWRAFYQT